MPAQSPTLSPTLSAIVAGLRGSSSGMPASILPTRSAPTSAAFVKMPPPTRRNSASSEPPNPKPMRIAEAVFWNSMMMIVAPNRPRPTVNMPATPPVRKATLSAAGSEPDFAAAAVRTLPRTARLMPMKPVRPRESATGEEGEGAEDAGLDKSQPLGSAYGDEWLHHFGRGDEHDDRERHQDHGDGLELPPQVRHRAFLDGGGDLDHGGRALIGGQDAAHEVEADRDREQSSAGREDEPEPLTALQPEDLVATFRGQADHSGENLVSSEWEAKWLRDATGRRSSESNLSSTVASHSRWYGSDVTTVPFRNSSRPFRSSALCPWRRFPHQWLTTNSGRSTVTTSFS